jgi:hypothetical protein
MENLRISIKILTPAESTGCADWGISGRRGLQPFGIQGVFCLFPPGKRDPMAEQFTKDKILKHLDGLNELERKQGSEKLVRIIAARYGVAEELVEQVIAEWSAGGKKSIE